MSENSIRFGSAVIVKDSKGGILFGKSNKPPLDGTWILPGGGVNFGETMKSAAKREIKEETGLDIQLGKQVKTYEIIIPEANRHRIVIYHEATLLGENQEIKCSDDLDEARFFTSEEFKQVKTTNFILNVLKDYGWL